MLARRALGFIGGLAVATGLGTATLRAQTPAPALDIASGGLGALVGANGAFNLGYQFSVNTPMFVTALGDFDGDPDGDGLGSPSNLPDSTDPQLVGLWDSNGNLIASAVVDSSSTQVGDNFAFTSLSTGLWLTPEELYTVGAQGDAAYTFDNTLNVLPQIDFYQDEYSAIGSGLTEPTTSFIGPGGAYLGGDVMLETTPEPGSFVLLALGFSGMLLLLRRRVRQAARP